MPLILAVLRMRSRHTAPCALTAAWDFWASTVSQVQYMAMCYKLIVFKYFGIVNFYNKPFKCWQFFDCTHLASSRFSVPHSVFFIYLHGCKARASWCKVDLSRINSLVQLVQ